MRAHNRPFPFADSRIGLEKHLLSRGRESERAQSCPSAGKLGLPTACLHPSHRRAPPLCTPEWQRLWTLGYDRPRRGNVEPTVMGRRCRGFLFSVSPSNTETHGHDVQTRPVVLTHRSEPGEELAADQRQGGLVFLEPTVTVGSRHPLRSKAGRTKENRRFLQKIAKSRPKTPKN